MRELNGRYRPRGIRVRFRGLLRRGATGLIAILLVFVTGCADSTAPNDNLAPSLSTGGGPDGVPIYEGNDDGSVSFLTFMKTSIITTSLLGRRVKSETHCSACWYLRHTVDLLGRYTDTNQQAMSGSGGTWRVNFLGKHDDELLVQLPRSCSISLDANTVHYISRRYWAPLPNGSWGFIDFAEKHGFTAERNLGPECEPGGGECEADARRVGFTGGPNLSVGPCPGEGGGGGGGGNDDPPSGYYITICTYLDWYDGDGNYLFTENLGCQTEWHEA